MEKKITQAQFDQICSEGAEFGLVYSPNSVHEESVDVGKTHSTEGTNKFLENLRSVLQFVKGDIWIYIYSPLHPGQNVVRIHPVTGEKELVDE